MVHEPDFVDECYKDKDLSLLKKLTLVIPTYNRNYYLSRCLWYHAHFPFGQIIVADSSPEEKKVVNRETVAKIKEMFGANVLYLEYQPETEKYGGDIYRKWADAVQHVEREYCQFCTDKEFVIPTTEIDCIQHLSVNLDYIAGHGYEYRIESNPDNEFKLINRHPTRKSEDLNIPLDRLNDSLVNVVGFSNSILLALTKTKNLKELYSIYYDNSNPHDLRYGELFLGYGGYVAGKVYLNPNLVSRIRDEIQRQKELTVKNTSFFNKSPESSTSRYPVYADYLRENTSEKYFYSVCYGFKKLLTEYSSLSEEEINNYLQNSEELKTVFNPQIQISQRLRNIGLNKLRSIYNKFPPSTRNIIRNTLIKINLKKEISQPALDGFVMEQPETQIIINVVLKYLKLKEEDLPVL